MAGQEPGVPRGFVGRFERTPEFSNIGEYAGAVAAALERRSSQQQISRLERTHNGPPLDIKRVAVHTITDDQFMAHWAREGRPVVLTGCTAGWDCDGVWNVGALQRRWGWLPWTARRGLSYDSMESFETTLGDYLSCSLEPEPEPEAAARSSSTRLYGANNYIPPELLGELKLPPFFPAHVKRMLDTRLWIGPPGAGVHMHRDLQDNFLLQVFGRKRVVLVAPHHAAELGCTATAGSVAHTTPFLHSTSLTLGQEPPDSVHATSAVLEPGEMLYLPAGYFHATTIVPSTEVTQDGACGVGCSVNYFMSACFASLGVIVPRLRAPDWLGPAPSTMLQDGRHGQTEKETPLSEEEGSGAETLDELAASID